MRVVQLDFEDPEFPARLIECDRPQLPGAAWARIAVSGGGICGSDLHIFKPTTGPSYALYSYGTLPMELGHEIAGTVVEAGPACAVEPGARVAVDPLLGCAARGVDPLCDRCASGAISACRSFGSGHLTAGMGTGFTHGLGAGWGDELVAHSTQLHTLPAGLGRDGETLVEPLSIAIHGLLRTPPRAGPVLVVGAGVIGLLAVAALRAYFPDLGVVAVAKYSHQADAARALGAHRVVMLGGSDALYADLAAITGGAVRGGGEHAVLERGFPYVVEAVGSEIAVGQALRTADTRGTVLLLGASGMSRVDLSPIWFREVAVTGSFCHAVDLGPDGSSAHSFDRAVDLLAGDESLAGHLVTHQFPLGQWREALDTAMRRESGAIKVVLRPQSG